MDITGAGVHGASNEDNGGSSREEEARGCRLLRRLGVAMHGDRHCPLWSLARPHCGVLHLVYFDKACA